MMVPQIEKASPAQRSRFEDSEDARSYYATQRKKELAQYL